MYRRLVRTSRAIAIAVCASVLTACGGGGAGVATSVASMQAQRRAVSSAATQSAAGKVTFSIGIKPKPAASPGRLAPAYVSPSTASMQILINGSNPVVVNLTPSSPNCTSHNAPPGSYICSAFFNAPEGDDVFTVTTYDQPDAQGSVLSTNTTGTVDVKPAGTTRVSIVLNGVVERAALALTTPNPPVGAPAVIGLSVVFADAEDNLIVGPAPFDYPVTLTTSDAVNGALSKTVLNSPADAGGVTVSYSGAKIATITFSATAPDLGTAHVLPGVLKPGASTGPQHLYIVNGGGYHTTPGILVYKLSDLTAAPTIIPGGGKSFCSVAVDSSDRLYAYESTFGTTTNISVFDLAHGGAVLPTIPTTANNFHYGGTAVDPSGRLYATSWDGSIVEVFDTANDDLPLTPISNGLNIPDGLALDASGKLFVVNIGSDSISVFDTTRGNALLPSITGGDLSSPGGATVDASGKLYVANTLPGSISVFDTLHGNAALPAITGAGLINPQDVAVDATGKLYVLNASEISQGYDPFTVSVFDTVHNNKLLTVITLPKAYNGYSGGITVH